MDWTLPIPAIPLSFLSLRGSRLTIKELKLAQANPERLAMATVLSLFMLTLSTVGSDAQLPLITKFSAVRGVIALSKVARIVVGKALNKLLAGYMETNVGEAAKV